MPDDPAGGDLDDPSKGLGHEQEAADSDAKRDEESDRPLKAPASSSENDGFATTGTADYAAQHQEASDESSTNRSLAASTKAIAWLTFALAVIGVLGFGASLLQWQVIHNQLDIMRADERPWLSVEIDDDAIATVQEKTLTLPLRFTIENVGKLPALGIVAGFRLTNTLSDNPTVVDLIDECGHVEFSEGSAIEGPLFPGKRREQTIMRSDAAMRRSRARPSGDDFLLVCVSYRLGQGDVRGRTGFAKVVTSLNFRDAIDKTEFSLKFRHNDYADSYAD